MTETIYVVYGNHFEASEVVAVCRDKKTAEMTASMCAAENIGNFYVKEVPIIDEPEVFNTYL